MMKKLLVLVLALAFVATASAGLVLNLDGSAISVGVEEGTQLIGGDLRVELVGASGSSLDSSGVIFETAPIIREWVDIELPQYGVSIHEWQNNVGSWDADWSVIASDSSSMLASGGNLPNGWNAIGAFTLLDGLALTDAGEGFTIQLVAASDIRTITYTGGTGEGDPAVADDTINLYSQGSIIGSIDVAAVPEPITVALLGLGGLFIRRRK